MVIKSIVLATGLILVKAVSADPIVMGYYANYDTYHNYPFPGNAQGASNNDLEYKLTRINTLAYAFFNISADGSIVSGDAWADLSNSETDQTFCKANLGICGGQIPAGGLGNFDAFANSSVPNRVISVGGYNSDNAWTAMLSSQTNITNFVHSIAATVATYKLSGIDLDYEPQGGMPAENIGPFIQMVTQLRQALGDNALITYAILANPSMIDTFGANNWQALMQQLSYVDLMAYDMHGSFDNPHLTGLQSALYPVPGDATGFSDETAVQTLTKNGVSAKQIILGFPAYVRAVGGVAAPGGVDLPFTEAVRGDLDSADCSTQLGQSNTCGGSIQYSTLLVQGYEANNYNVNGIDAGVWAYQN